MTKIEKRRKIKEIYDEIPSPYTESGYADINKSRYIADAEEVSTKKSAKEDNKVSKKSNNKERGM